MTDTVLPISFPCPFPIKVVGKNTPEFETKVLGIIRKNVPDLGESAISERMSKDRNYLAITININATSQEQLDQIYRELSESPEVIMAL